MRFHIDHNSCHRNSAIKNNGSPLKNTDIKTPLVAKIKTPSKKLTTCGVLMKTSHYENKPGISLHSNPVKGFVSSRYCRHCLFHDILLSCTIYLWYFQSSIFAIAYYRRISNAIFRHALAKIPRKIKSTQFFNLKPSLIWWNSTLFLERQRTLKDGNILVCKKLVALLHLMIRLTALKSKHDLTLVFSI